MTTRRIAKVLCSLIALLTFVGCQEVHTTLTIRPDGTCEMHTRMVMKRLTAEQQVMMSRMRDMDMDDGEPTEPKTLSDEELAEGLKEAIAEQDEMMGSTTRKIEKVEVKKDTVLLVVRSEFDTVKKMLSQPRLLRDVGLSGMVIKKDDEGNLRVALMPNRMPKSRIKMMKQQLKFRAVKASLRLELPGKILKSALPNTEGKATWIVVDHEKDDTLEAMVKLAGSKEIVIVAETGGLKLGDTSLDSRKLARAQMGGDEPGKDLPITDAGPGFMVEASSITTTTVRFFKDAPEEFRDNDYEARRAGVSIAGKLFAPRGRKLLAVSGVRVISAEDDRGRSVSGADESENYMGRTSFSSGGEAEASQGIELRLKSPSRGAEAIEELRGEAIALTFGEWNIHRVSDVKEDPEKTIDLSSILPGARMVITKLTSKVQSSGGRRGQSRNGTISVKLSGSKDVAQIAFDVEVEGSEHSSCHNMGMRGRSGGDKTTRTVRLQYNTYSYREGGSVSGKLTLVVKYPRDMRRERVKFTLEGMDLF